MKDLPGIFKNDVEHLYPNLNYGDEAVRGVVYNNIHIRLNNFPRCNEDRWGVYCIPARWKIIPPIFVTPPLTLSCRCFSCANAEILFSFRRGERRNQRLHCERIQNDPVEDRECTGQQTRESLLQHEHQIPTIRLCHRLACCIQRDNSASGQLCPRRSLLSHNTSRQHAFLRLTNSGKAL